MDRETVRLVIAGVGVLIIVLAVSGYNRVDGFASTLSLITCGLVLIVAPFTALATSLAGILIMGIPVALGLLFAYWTVQVFGKGPHVLLGLLVGGYLGGKFVMSSQFDRAMDVIGRIIGPGDRGQ